MSHCCPDPVSALARRNFEGTRATLKATAGNLETLVDDALAFVEAATIFLAAKIVLISTVPSVFALAKPA